MKHYLWDRIKRHFALVLVLLLFEPVRAADNPWSRKATAEWDGADVHRILYDSPWVRHFTRTKRDLEFEIPDLGPSGNELRGYHAKESKEDGAITTEFYVRWVSSRTLRRALALRSAFLRHSKPESPTQNAPRMLRDFEVSIAGRDMSAFDQLSDGTLLAKCFLATNSRPKIRPTQVEVARSTDGKIRGVLFHFPRTTDGGEPLISSHERRVWFFEGAGEIQISVTFTPQTMMDEKGLDL